MSKHDQFIRLTHFLFAIKSGLGVKSGWRLDILFTLVLLFIVLETDFLLYVLSPAWISWYIFSTLFTTFRPIKSTLYSVFYLQNHTWEILGDHQTQHQEREVGHGGDESGDPDGRNVLQQLSKHLPRDHDHHHFPHPGRLLDPDRKCRCVLVHDTLDCSQPLST